MRIISGKARGTHLVAPTGSDVRPTSDRVKESLFSTLGNLDGWRVLDLFAGSGALGLEAFSRGADEVVLVERDRKALKTIEANLQAVEKAIGGGHSPVRVLQVDAVSVPHLLRAEAGTFDLIMADPPYHVSEKEFGAAALLCSESFANWAGEALLVLEHGADVELPWQKSHWRIIKQRRFGIRMISFCSQSESRAAPG